jgi:hypothetical protein
MEYEDKEPEKNDFSADAYYELHSALSRIIDMCRDKDYMIADIEKRAIDALQEADDLLNK